MTRFIALTAAIVISAGGLHGLLAADMTVPGVTVGRHLQAYTSVKLGTSAPEEGTKLTLTSDDPNRLLLSKSPDQPGSATISLNIPSRAVETPEFCLLALADSGTVTYSISVAGIGTAKGTVTLVPSAIVILGPMKATKYPTTPRGANGRIKVVSAALDPAGKTLAEQPLAGGTQVEVTLANSNPKAVKLAASKLKIEGGTSTATTYFQPMGEGETQLSPVQPPGFTMPAEMAAITVEVAKPGLAIAGEIVIGKGLQTSAALVLGEPAPEGGLKVTLTSADGAHLLLSPAEDQIGSASITVTVPAGKLNTAYYIQSLGDSGEVAYEATAPGFRSRTAKVELAPSCVIVAYESYGPPDEANVKRKIGGFSDRKFFVSMAEAKSRPVRLVVWTAYIDRESGRAADFTVEPLRAGLTLTIEMKSSNPEIATVDSPLTIKGGTNRVISKFTPLSKGTTVISIDTPNGFSTPKNANSVPAVISE